LLWIASDFTISTKQLERSAPRIPTKGWNIRALAFLRRAEVPVDNLENRAPDL
jgi:hypothetical protein